MQIAADRVDSPHLDLCRLARAPRELARAGLFVAESREVVRRLVTDSPLDVVRVVVTPTAHRALGGLWGRLPPDVPVVTAPREVLSAVAGFDIHRGCLAFGRRAPTASTSEIVGAGAEGRRVVVLEAVSNPDNVGSIARSAWALGAHGLILDTASADPLYRKAIRTSMGATLCFPWTVTRAPIPALLAELASHGYQVLALTPRDDTVALHDLEGRVGGRVALVAGSEGRGLSAEVLASARIHVRIPMAREDGCLNVGVSVAVALACLGGGAAEVSAKGETGDPDGRY